MFRSTVSAIAAVILTTATVHAAPKPEALTVKVVSVRGDVEKRNTADAQGKWQPAKAGDVLGELWLIRTGLGSRVVIQMADRNKITVREGTKMGIAEFRNIGGRKVKTQLGLKYGSIRTDVDSTRGGNDFKLATPVAIMSIGGTHTSNSFNGDTGYAHQNHSGSSNSTNTGTGGTRNTTEGEGTDGQGTRDGDQNKSDAGTGSTTDPNGGSTSGEQHAANTNGGGGGAFGNGACGGSTPGGSVGGFGGGGPAPVPTTPRAGSGEQNISPGY